MRILGIFLLATHTHKKKNEKKKTEHKISQSLAK